MTVPFLNTAATPHATAGIPQEPTGDALWSWLDASDTATVTDESGRVTNWADKSGNGHYAYQVSGSNAQPYTAQATMNGLNVISFFGGQRFAFPANAFPNTSGDNSILVLAKQDAGNKDTWIISGRNISDMWAYSLLGSSSAQGGSVTATWHHNTDIIPEVVPGNPDGLPHVYGFVRDGAIIKAVYDDTLSTGRAAEDITMEFNLYIGCRFSGGPYAGYFSGTIAEVLIYDKALTAAELAHNLIYLRSKWGL